MKKYVLWVIVILAAAAGWKIWLLSRGVFPFNADEAVVALMGRHILAGARPIFFYGQAYMGSLDAFLVALGFLVFGQHVWVIRLVQTVLYLVTIITTVWLGEAVFSSKKAGLLGGGLLAVPTVNVTLYTTVSLGGYGEALVIGNLVLLTGLALIRLAEAGFAQCGQFKPYALFFLLGVLCGCGLWANGITLVYSIPVWLMLLWVLLRRSCCISWRTKTIYLLAAVLGGVIGSLPWWLYAFSNGFQALILELLGSAVNVEGSNFILRSFNHLVSLVVLGIPVIFGFRPPWEIRWLVLPLIPLLMIFWAFVWVIFAQLLERKSAMQMPCWLLASVLFVLCMGFIFTSFGVDPSGRYFLPLSVPLALLAGYAILSIPWGDWLKYLILALVIGYHAGGTLQCAANNPPGLSTQFNAITVIDHRYDEALVDFLRRKGEFTGYTNYWVSYPLAFHSEETMIYTPKLPYHADLRYTPRDNRYPVYDTLIEQTGKAAYITTKNPVLDDYLREKFSGVGVTWKEERIGDYQVFYQLSRFVKPEAIGLGVLKAGKIEAVTQR